MGTEISSQEGSVENPEAVLTAKNLNVYYGDFLAVRDVNMEMKRNTVTALIGPSGCGKSTYLRCLNRMNDLIVGASVKGEVLFENFNIYSDNVDATEIRSRIGMVFQKPNPFPKSIYQNVAFGLKVNGITSQKRFLQELGILERAEIISKNLPFSKKANIYLRLKKLMDENAMGKLFKVMFISKKNMKFKIGFNN